MSQDTLTNQIIAARIDALTVRHYALEDRLESGDPFTNTELDQLDAEAKAILAALDELLRIIQRRRA